MRTKLVLGFILLSALLLPFYAQAGEYDDVEMYGFSLIADNDELVHLKFRDQYNFIISKKRFNEVYRVKEFCNSVNESTGLSVALSPIGSGAMLLAMSGVASTHQFLMDALRLEFEHPTRAPERFSGLWYWSVNGNIILMPDGRGFTAWETSLHFLNFLLNTHLKLNAICDDVPTPPEMDPKVYIRTLLKK